jgi:hypothetical protein
MQMGITSAVSVLFTLVHGILFCRALFPGLDLHLLSQFLKASLAFFGGCLF